MNLPKIDKREIMHEMMLVNGYNIPKLAKALGCHFSSVYEKIHKREPITKDFALKLIKVFKDTDLQFWLED